MAEAADKKTGYSGDVKNVIANTSESVMRRLEKLEEETSGMRIVIGSSLKSNKSIAASVEVGKTRVSFIEIGRTKTAYMIGARNARAELL